MTHDTTVVWAETLMTYPVPSASNLETGDAEIWSNVMEDLKRIGTLQDDWDGAGAVAPVSELVRTAKEFVLWMRDDGVRAPDRIVPTPMGTILLEWHDVDKYTEAEVVSEEELEWMDDCAGKISHWSTPTPRRRALRPIGQAALTAADVLAPVEASPSWSVAS